MAKYNEREELLDLVKHLGKYNRCKNCYHLASCDAWVRNVTTLYDDYSYSVENCPYYTPTADVVEVVRCKDCCHYIEMKGFDYNGRKSRSCVWHSALRGENDYCSDAIRNTRTKERGADK